MPKFFCDYCDVYLTHDSMSVRRAHNSGRNHLRNVVEYYQQIGQEKAQSVIDSITSARTGCRRSWWTARNARNGWSRRSARIQWTAATGWSTADAVRERDATTTAWFPAATARFSAWFQPSKHAAYAFPASDSFWQWPARSGLTRRGYAIPASVGFPTWYGSSRWPKPCTAGNGRT
ncbi:hypothetical protein D0859_08027 [Hortaea werneckii]|uniref:Matrin-type domain-containing protein n=1 Tax=Hortaea werneckii TaxID=91943 RepID=A0A3M7IRB0_HORWE|nr:hypothetical protein D0859_08027 [Hortaea werneckii]